MLWIAIYSFLLLVALLNWLLIPRLTRESASTEPIVVCIPCRNEAHNLPTLLAGLAGARVIVCDDNSEDETASVARSLGAEVIQAGPLPTGWTGKNHACARLAEAALATDATWVVFLDADTMPNPDFAPRLSSELAHSKEQVCSGFLRLIPGRGFEPAYLGWVFWIILATNPLGLVARTGWGHSGFLNGQFIAWRRDFLAEHQPYHHVSGEILEDIKLGRWLARSRTPVRILSLGTALKVRMYETIEDAWAGMLKNSHAIAGTGSFVLAVLVLTVAWGWVFAGSLRWVAFLLLVLGKVVTDRVTGSPTWTAPLMPLTLTAAALTILLSRHLKRQGRLTWKGRTYS